MYAPLPGMTGHLNTNRNTQKSWRPQRLFSSGELSPMLPGFRTRQHHRSACALHLAGTRQKMLLYLFSQVALMWFSFLPASENLIFPSHQVSSSPPSPGRRQPCPTDVSTPYSLLHCPWVFHSLFPLPKLNTALPQSPAFSSPTFFHAMALQPPNTP